MTLLFSFAQAVACAEAKITWYRPSWAGICDFAQEGEERD